MDRSPPTNTQAAYTAALTASWSERLGIDWLEKLRVMLQVCAFALAVAAVQVAFMPERPYPIAMAYSLCIALVSWLVIDLGRHLFRSARETGWPEGAGGVALVAAGMVVGFLVGSRLADDLCVRMDWYRDVPRPDPGTELRISVLITVIATSVASLFFYFLKKSDYLERKMAQTRRQADEARLRLLESQLEPHMLFNTLANLRVLIPTDPARATAMLDRIIAYLRATLAASRLTRHALANEFDRLRDYLELMAVRLGPRLAYELSLPDGLAPRLVPALLLQPLVENSIRHGIECCPGGGTIRVSARAQDDLLLLEVLDSGPGVAPAPMSPPSTGFGLEQVRSRLDSEYGAQASLQLEPTHDGGMRARLSLPWSMTQPHES